MYSWGRQKKTSTVGKNYGTGRKYVNNSDYLYRIVEVRSVAGRSVEVFFGVRHVGVVELDRVRYNPLTPTPLP